MNYEGTITPAYIQLADAPTKPSYTFQGWTDEQNSETGKWSAKQTVEFENIENTLYAAWRNTQKCSYCSQTFQYGAAHYHCSGCRIRIFIYRDM